VGKHLSDISLSIEKTIKKAHFSPVAALTGHGIGRQLHEDPNIPCVAIKKTQDFTLKPGMTFAIEVIYNQGRPDLILSEDDWTILTKDGKISGLFEETVAVTKNGPLVLTA
jgi:methionyl aminopeptidase